MSRAVGGGRLGLPQELPDLGGDFGMLSQAEVTAALAGQNACAGGCAGTCRVRLRMARVLYTFTDGYTPMLISTALACAAAAIAVLAAGTVNGTAPAGG
jgi:hypothetical protein